MAEPKRRMARVAGRRRRTGLAIRAVGLRLAGRPRSELPPDARVGVDLVEIEPFRARVEGRDALLHEIFTDAELEYARARRRLWVHLAARFAAKEATFKALGCGVAGAVTWRDVEVLRDEAGEPSLTLSGATARRADALGLHRFALSLSHGRQYAIAVVLAFGA